MWKMKFIINKNVTMKWINLNQESGVNSSHELLSTELEQVLQEFSKDSKELQDKIQYFEYKNKSKDGKYYVFSYNAITWEHIDDIKQKYMNQYKYKWEKGEIIITDDKWHEILGKEFRKNTKIYLKIRRNEDRCPVRFFDFKLSKGEQIYKCFIDTDGWTPHSIRQIYQDQSNKIIPEGEFQLLDLYENPYDESVIFKPWDVITIKFEKWESNAKAEENIEKVVEQIHHEESFIEDKPEQKPTIKETEEKESIYKEMIETQWIPLSHWNKNKPEISLTFDDWYWESYIRSILDTLRWSWIKATFFVLWECVKKSKNLWKQAIEDWHQICCHTYSHAYLNEWETTELFKWHWISSERRPGLIQAWDKNVKRLLWIDYYNTIKANNPWIPEVMNSATLLETELLMWEEEVRQSLWEDYLTEMKLNHPFFRFPGGCGSKRMENINVLKKYWYLAIWRNSEPKFEIPGKIENWDIPLFHFDQKNISALNQYISKLTTSWKKPKLISEIIL